ncbi:molecular chaperone DnaJ [Lujinxingia sediminis]|uniref:Molecular chaperone DnaJ n=2 Tax=Lujinxingia sediminis TaxID=2480984 RepID=A0ABY0CTF0_9DELT|nr:molecular chaperone DnaJ [Lujinxingia sediminis]
MKDDLYGILGVSKKTDAATIKKAYRKLARENHPDVNPGDAAAEERFKRISAAFDVLSDPKKRKLYDEFGFEGLREGFDAKRARATRRRGGASAAGFEGGASFEDIFGSMFGGGAGPGFGGAGFGGGAVNPLKGRDNVMPVELDFMRALKGTELTFSEGETKTFKVRVPEGTGTGDRLRVKGKGGAAPRTRQGKGERGDLLLEFKVLPHPKLRREGLDLYLDVPITVPEAVCGASISVPTPHGDYTVKVPEGVNSGAKLRLKGQGVKRGTHQGNFYVVLQVHTPDRIDDATRKAATQLAGGYSQDVRAGLKL